MPRCHSGGGGEARVAAHAELVHAHGRECGETAGAVAHAAPEIDRRGFLHVPHRHGDIADLEPERDGLDEELLVEGKVVGVLVELHALQHPSRIGTKARMEIAQRLTEDEILEERAHAVDEVLPTRHPAIKRFPARADTVAEHNIADAEVDELSHDRADASVVLVIRVKHDDDIGIGLERCGIARLLIAAVAAIRWMRDDAQAERLRDIDGVIGARIVNEDAVVAESFRNLVDRRLDRECSVVGGKHERDLRRRCHQLQQPPRDARIPT